MVTENLSVGFSSYYYAISQYYIDAAYCHRRSSVVCRSVMITSPAKTTEAIETFAMWTQMGPRNHVLDGGPDPTPLEGQC